MNRHRHLLVPFWFSRFRLADAVVVFSFLKVVDENIKVNIAVNQASLGKPFQLQLTLVEKIMLLNFATRLPENSRGMLNRIMSGLIRSSGKDLQGLTRITRVVSIRGSVKFVKTSTRVSVPGFQSGKIEMQAPKLLPDKKVIPDADPPGINDVDRLYQFFDRSTKVVVLTGAGISTECGIPDYRSPNGAYSTGFKPITHQVLDNVILKTGRVSELSRRKALSKEFVRSSRARRRYWARSYAGWRRFTAAQPSPAHAALASLEKAGRIDLIITQNVDRLHHRAGSNPLELHGTVYTVVCLNCGFSFCRESFQEQVKGLNPKWAAAIESLNCGNPGSDKSFGMKQRPDGDIEIDEKFWEEDFHIPTCEKCNGVLKPDVVFFGDNVPKDRADKAMEASKGCDALLVLGSSLMTMSAYRLVRAAHEAGAATAIVNIGVTRADEFVPLKINARLGEILPRVLDVGSLSVPAP